MQRDSVHFPVLVVDDDDSIRQLVSRVLVRAGFEVEQARNGAEALDRIRASDFSAIALDLMMPVVNGFDVLDALRDERPDLLKRVCVMTAASDQHLERIDRSTIYTVVRKPFDLLELSNCIKSAAEGRPPAADAASAER